MASYSPTVTTIITRTNDLREIEFGLRRYERLILLGPGGIGKTTLLRNFWLDHQKDYYANRFVSGYELERDRNVNTIIKELTNYKRSLFIVDGFDEILSDSIKEDILTIYKESKKYGMDIIMSARSEIGLKQFQRNSHTYRLEGFTEKQTEELFNKLIENVNVIPQEYEAIKNIIRRFENSPLAVTEIAQLFNSYPDIEHDILHPLTAGINYEDKLFQEINTDKKIITPEQKSLITEIKVIERDLVQLIKKNPIDIYGLSPRQFEEFVVEIYKKNGFDVVLTQKTRDGGKDFIITNKSLLGNQLIYGECKQKRPDKPVGVGVIRELHSTIMTDKATAGIVVSSSYFSPDASKLANAMQHQMTLVDFVKLNKMIETLSR